MTNANDELKALQAKVPYRKLSDTTLVTGAYRCSFPEIFELKSSERFPDRKPECSITLLVSEGDPMAKELAGMIKGVMTAKFNGKIPYKWRNPMRKAEEFDPEKYPEYAGHWVLKINNKRDLPAVFGPEKDIKGNLVPITNPREIYPGCVVRVKFDVYAYSGEFEGAGLSLRLVQKIADMEPFGRGGGAPETGDDLDDLDLPATAKVEAADPFADFGE
jgi:hypothetical protein